MQGKKWSEYDKDWFEKYNLAKEYYLEHGNLKIPFRYSSLKDGIIINLGTWVMTQRQGYLKGTLSKERIDLLNEIGMAWKINNTYSWEYMYNLAKDYYLENNKLFSSTYKININDKNVLLGAWFRNQIKFYNEGKLSIEKIKLLENIGVQWKAEQRKRNRKDNRDKKWFSLYKEVLEFYKEHGNLIIPNDYLVTVSHEEILLKSWYKNQKSMLKLKELSAEKEKLINELIMLNENNKIKTENDKNWFEIYNVAVNYYKEHGDLKVPYTYVYEKDGIKINLGQWVISQRQNYGNNKISADKIKLLDKIGMKWEKKNWFTWEYVYKLAKDYYKEHGDLLVPRNLIVNVEGTDISLGNWIVNQRRSYKKKTLSSERIELLNEIGMKWEDVKQTTDDKNWLILFKNVVEYYEENETTNISSDYEVLIENKSINLNRWYTKQLYLCRNNKLSSERKKLIEAFSNKVNDKRAENLSRLKWMKNYELAKKYFMMHGNLRIPNTYEVEVNGEIIKLGDWINSQRSSYKGRRAKISGKQINLLNEIGMIWEFNSERMANWLEKYKFIKEYYDKNGDLFFPKNYTIEVNGKIINLKKWLNAQKNLYKNGKLSIEKAKLLEEIGITSNNSKVLSK